MYFLYYVICDVLSYFRLYNIQFKKVKIFGEPRVEGRITQTPLWNCLIFCMILKENYGSYYIILTDQILLSSCF